MTLTVSVDWAVKHQTNPPIGTDRPEQCRTKIIELAVFIFVCISILLNGRLLESTYPHYS